MSYQLKLTGKEASQTMTRVLKKRNISLTLQQEREATKQSFYNHHDL